MTVQFEITKKDVLLQVKTEAFVTGEANKDGELSRINHATKTQASDDDDDILNEYINTAACEYIYRLVAQMAGVKGKVQKRV